MKKILVLTTTRADYSLLSPIIKKLKECKGLTVEVVATGTHLSNLYGYTINEIDKDGVCISKEIDILSNINSPVGIALTMSNALSLFAEYFDESKPDALLVLGDRYETLAVCLSAAVARIPIIHIHGGEITEGAIDNAIRHSITKLSSLHFASTEEYRKRIIQMGENPETVFNVGAVGVENVLSIKTIEKTELEKELGFSLKKYALLTFHPVTLENNTAEEQVTALLNVLVNDYKDIVFICTKANADLNGILINKILDRYSCVYSNIKVFDSLGSRKYLSLMKNACFVIGNSSSGIIETPSFKIPTINIGDRQKGRVQAQSIINCEANSQSINDAIIKALSPEFLESLKDVSNPYEKKNTSSNISSIITDFILNDKLILQKKFYDIGDIK